MPGIAGDMPAARVWACRYVKMSASAERFPTAVWIIYLWHLKALCNLQVLLMQNLLSLVCEVCRLYPSALHCEAFILLKLNDGSILIGEKALGPQRASRRQHWALRCYRGLRPIMCSLRNY